MSATRIGAGFRILWYGVVNTSGVFLGGTTTAPTAGDTNGSGLVRLHGAQTMPIQIPENTNLVVSGDDQPMVQFGFDPDALVSGAFGMAAANNDFEALIQGTKVQDLGTLEIGMLDPKDRADQTMCLLLSRRAKSWESGTRGASKWENYLIPNCTIKPLGVAVEQRAHNPYQYSFTVSRSDRILWTTINNTDHGTTAASILRIDTDDPLHVQRFTGNAAQTAFVLDYTPQSGARTYVYVNDLRQTVTTDYTVAGKTVTFVAPPADGAVIGIPYEFDESELQ